MDPRACHRKNLSEGLLVLYSKSENDPESLWRQGIIENFEVGSEIEFGKHGYPIRLTNGDIGFVKQIIDTDEINSEHIINLIKIDENQKLEFKETFSVDNESGEKLKCLKDATVKEVAAFMNTLGGTILIGVSNDRSIVGIERDFKIIDVDPKKKETPEDKFKRNIEDMIRNRLKDPSITDYFDIHLVPVEENELTKTVGVIKVRKCPKAIFMDVDVSISVCGTNKTKSSTKQVFYIRTPDSKVREVEPRDLQDFLKNRNLSDN